MKKKSLILLSKLQQQPFCIQTLKIPFKRIIVKNKQFRPISNVAGMQKIALMLQQTRTCHITDTWLLVFIIDDMQKIIKQTMLMQFMVTKHKTTTIRTTCNKNVQQQSTNTHRRIHRHTRHKTSSNICSGAAFKNQQNETMETTKNAHVLMCIPVKEQRRPPHL